MSSPIPPTARQTRDLREVQGADRSAAQSLWRTHAERRGAGGFLKKHLIPWLTHYLATVTLPRRPFAQFKPESPVPHGIINFPLQAKIGLAADWGTGTDSAYRVGDLIASHSPDFTIHLGDVYYSGESDEYAKYFFAPNAWPKGRIRTFALNANHEMYSGGEGYFDHVLATLGQETSYFCLENEHWRILGLDTGYYARTFPLLEPLLSGLIRLHSDIQKWLAEVVFANPNDRRPAIALSHHQWFSSYDTEYHGVGSNLSSYFDRIFLWIWGHEHRFAAYGPFGFGGKTVRARCIGHGGMPIELKEKVTRDRPLLLTDRRKREDVDGVALGFCGFAMLRFDGPQLNIEYRDEEDTLVFEEKWTSNKVGATGRKLSILEDAQVPALPTNDPTLWVP